MPATPLQALHPVAVTTAQARLGHVGGVVSEDRHQQLAGAVGVPDRQGDAHPPAHPVARHHRQALAPQVLGQVHQEAVGCRGLGHALGRLPARTRQDLAQQARPGRLEAVGVNVLGGQAGDHLGGAPGDSQGLHQSHHAPVRGDRAEGVDGAPVGRLGVAHREDDVVPAQGAHLGQVHHREGLTDVLREERLQGGRSGGGRVNGPLDLLSVPGVEGDDRQAALRCGQGVLNDQVHHPFHLGGDGLHGGLARGGHAASLDQVQAELPGTRRGGDGVNDVVVAVSGQEDGDLRVQRVTSQRQGHPWQEGAELGGQAEGVPARVADHQHLLGADEGWQDLGHGHLRGGVQDRQVHHGVGGEDLRHEGGRHDPHRSGGQGQGEDPQDVTQGQLVLPAQGQVEGAGGVLVGVDAGTHPGGVGGQDRPGQ